MGGGCRVEAAHLVVGWSARSGATGGPRALCQEVAGGKNLEMKMAFFHRLHAITTGRNNVIRIIKMRTRMTSDKIQGGLRFPHHRLTSTRRWDVGVTETGDIHSLHKQGSPSGRPRDFGRANIAIQPSSILPQRHVSPSLCPRGTDRRLGMTPSVDLRESRLLQRLHSAIAKRSAGWSHAAAGTVHRSEATR